MKISKPKKEAPSVAEPQPPMDDASSVTPNEPMPEGPDMMGGNEPMGNEPMPDAPAEGDDSTMSIINQLSDTDKKAVRAYAESMLSREEDKNNEGGDNEPPMGGEMPTEGRCYTKNELNEVFGLDNLSVKKDEPKTDKRKDNTVKNSPFNSPKFKTK